MEMPGGPCPKCGYVHGATTGYPKLTRVERRFLFDRGYVFDVNLHGDEIAQRPGGGSFLTARAALHRVYCRPTTYDRILKPEI